MPGDKNVFWVVVLGDFGRSPRMQYHTVSLASKPNTEVHVIAYGGSKPIPAIQQAKNVHIVPLPELPARIKMLPRVLLLFFKVLHQLMWLFMAFFVNLPTPRAILLQCPPSIPTILLCMLASKIRRCKFVIDWHNYGYSIMALTSGHRSPLVRYAKAHEMFWARYATTSFCVTKAMQQDLQDNWHVQSTVLHDRPPKFFQRTPLPAMHDLVTRLQPDLLQQPFNDYLSSMIASCSQGQTILSMSTPSGAINMRADRPAVVVSSTSWTPDEDFKILLDAAVAYDKLAASSSSSLPKLLLLITGKGPQKDHYIGLLSHMAFTHVAIRTLWLEASDYPLLLGSVDIGVSLHASSSGLDLPMKVVDMYGSGLPVCALSYSCIGELVQHEQTGLLFSSAQQLAEQLADLLRGFPATTSALLSKLQTGVRDTQQSSRWEENWDRVAWPVLSM